MWIHVTQIENPSIYLDLQAERYTTCEISDFLFLTYLMYLNILFTYLMYGVATVSRIDNIIGLFCRIASLLQKRPIILSILLIVATPYLNILSTYLMHLHVSHSFISFMFDVPPTPIIMYVPLQVNRFQTGFLRIVQYKYFKSCSGDFYSSESDPPHKIVRYWFYYSI